MKKNKLYYSKVYERISRSTIYFAIGDPVKFSKLCNKLKTKPDVTADDFGNDFGAFYTPFFPTRTFFLWVNVPNIFDITHEIAHAVNHLTTVDRISVQDNNEYQSNYTEFLLQQFIDLIKKNKLRLIY